MPTIQVEFSNNKMAYISCVLPTYHPLPSPTSYQECPRDCISPHSIQQFYVRLLNFCHLNGNKISSYCGLDLRFLSSNKIEYLFIHLEAISFFSSEFTGFYLFHFSTRLFVFVILICRNKTRMSANATAVQYCPGGPCQ